MSAVCDNASDNSHNEFARQLARINKQYVNVDVKREASDLTELYEWCTDVQLSKRFKSNHNNKMELKDLLDDAVEQERQEDVKSILSRYVDSKQLQKDSSNAMHVAVAKQQVDTVRVLLAAGANINVKEKKSGMTPLHLAIKHNDLAMARLLLAEKAKVNELTKHNSTALHMAVENQAVILVKLLLVNDANVNAKKFGRNPLHVAVEKRNLELAKILLDSGCKVNDVGNDGSSALHTAVEARDLRMVELLLASGARTSFKKFGLTPLCLAVKNGCMKTVKALLSQPSDCSEEERARDLSCAVDLAIQSKNRAMVHWLLEHGDVDVNLRVSDRSLLQRVIEADWLDTLELFIAKGAKLQNPSANEELSAMQLALKLKNYEAARLLLHRGAEVNRSSGGGGLSPLHLAVSNGSAEMTALVLEHGAQVDALTERGLTALQITFGAARLDLATLLMDYGADPRLCTDGYGKRPLEVSIEGRWLDMVRRILQAGVDPNTRGFDGASILSHAIRSREVVFVKMLLEAGADPEFSGGGVAGRTPPLVQAVELRCSAELLSALLEHGASIDSLDQITGMNALQLAVSHGCEELAKLLVARGAKLDYALHDGSTALLLGLDKCARRLVELLLQSGADVKLRRPGCPSPLRRAISLDWQPIVQLMLDRGAANGEGVASLAEPLCYAVSKGDARMFDQLLKLGADPFAEAEDQGRTLLHVAAGAARHCPEIVEELLARGVRVNAADKKSAEGLTPLHCALLSGNEDTALLLLDRGASLRMRERFSSRGPLHLAAETGCARVARRLLSLGDPSVLVDERASHGVTPLQIAAMNGQPQVAELLIGYGAQVDLISGGEHFSPLHCAICHRGYEVAEVLLSAGALGFGCVCHPNPSDIMMKPERSPFGYARRNVDCERLQQLLLQYDNSVAGTFGSDLIRDDMLSYLSGLENPTPLVKVYIKHIAKKGMRVAAIDLKPRLLELYEQCIAEVERMRRETFYEQLTFGCILDAGIDSLRGFVRNESLVRAFDESHYQMRFPLYENIVADSMARARNLEMLYVNGERLLHRLFHLPYEIGRKILKMLCVTDIRNLNNVLPEDDEDDEDNAAAAN